MAGGCHVRVRKLAPRPAIERPRGAEVTPAKPPPTSASTPHTVLFNTFNGVMALVSNQTSLMPSKTTDSH